MGVIDALCPNHIPTLGAGLVVEDEARVRLGILGTANIARKNIVAAAEVKGLEIAAIGSRSQEKADAFAKEFGIPMAYPSYQHVLDDKDIDAVYIPLPTKMHLEWVTKAAQAGKHVLCEKPCAVDGEELLKMLQVCDEHNVVFMDGVMFMHHDRLRLLCKELSTEQFGPLGPLHVLSDFSFPPSKEFLENNIRCNPDADFLGSLGDLGWYNIRFALFCFGWEMPKFATGVTNSEAKGVPLDVNGTLSWSSVTGDGIERARSTAFHCSFLCVNQQHATVSGAHSSIKLEDFVITRTNDSADWQIESNQKWSQTKDGTSITSTKETKQSERCRQESMMLQAFRNLVNAKKNGTCSFFWPAVALATQLCTDAVFESCKLNGAKVPVDPKGLFTSYTSSKA